MYGITKNPDTKNYLMVFQNINCEECSKHKQCKLCQIDHLSFFTNWNSGNKIIDNFIQEMQLKIDSDINMVFEWIPYNQFNYVKEIGKGGFAKVYLAKWKDGPLYYSDIKKEYTRNQNKKVALKCLYNSQSITDEFLNEVWIFLFKFKYFF